MRYFYEGMAHLAYTTPWGGRPVERQCFTITRQVWHQFTNSKGMKGLDIGQIGNARYSGA